MLILSSPPSMAWWFRIFCSVSTKGMVCNLFSGVLLVKMLEKIYILRHMLVSYNSSFSGLDANVTRVADVPGWLTLSACAHTVLTVYHWWQPSFFCAARSLHCGIRCLTTSTLFDSFLHCLNTSLFEYSFCTVVDLVNSHLEVHHTNSTDALFLDFVFAPDVDCVHLRAGEVRVHGQDRNVDS